MDYISFFRNSTYDMDGERVLCNRYDASIVCYSDLGIQNAASYDGDHIPSLGIRETKEQRKQRMKEQRLEDAFNTIENIKRLSDIRAGNIRPHEPRQPWKKCPPFAGTEFNNTCCGLVAPGDADREAQCDMAPRTKRGEKKSDRRYDPKGNGRDPWSTGLSVCLVCGGMGD